jgi:hypothetical protein
MGSPPALPSPDPSAVLTFRDGRLITAASSAPPAAARDDWLPSSPATRRRAPRARRSATIAASEAAVVLPLLNEADPELDPKGAALEREVERLLAILSPAMRAGALPFRDEELQALAKARHVSPEAVAGGQLAGICLKAGISTVRSARYALTRLGDFGAAFGLTPDCYDFSSGFVSAFLSAQTAPSMPAALLRGLRWARNHLGAKCDVLTDALDPFNRRYHGGTHATTWYAFACAKWAAVAAGDESVAPILALPHAAYLRAVCSGLTLMVNASLRWADAQGSQDFAVLPDAVQGFCKKAKAGAPMHWWGDRLDLLGSSSWSDPLVDSLRSCSPKPTFIFRRADFTTRRGGDPAAFTGWAKGPASKPHVSRAGQHVLTAEPFPVPAEIAAAVAKKLHGARRVYPTGGRMLSAVLKLTLDDRDELGRWQPPADPAEASQGRARAMSNLYSSDAQRSRCVATRKRVGDAMRAAIAAAGWSSLPRDGSWEFLLPDSGSTAVDAIEPYLDPTEAEGEVGQ